MITRELVDGQEPQSRRALIEAARIIANSPLLTVLEEQALEQMRVAATSQQTAKMVEAAKSYRSYLEFKQNFQEIADLKITTNPTAE